jgi:hypothetical protein
VEQTTATVPELTTGRPFLKASHSKLFVAQFYRFTSDQIYSAQSSMSSWSCTLLRGRTSTIPSQASPEPHLRSLLPEQVCLLIFFVLRVLPLGALLFPQAATGTSMRRPLHREQAPLQRAAKTAEGKKCKNEQSNSVDGRSLVRSFSIYREALKSIATPLPPQLVGRQVTGSKPQAAYPHLPRTIPKTGMPLNRTNGHSPFYCSFAWPLYLQMSELL